MARRRGSRGCRSGRVDLWVPVPETDGQVVLVRFWRRGRDSGDLYIAFRRDYMAGSFGLMYPVFFSAAVHRPFWLERAEPPAGDGSVEGDGRWRLAGCRLGTIFHTKGLAKDEAAFLSAGGARRVDRLAVFLVFVAWLVAMFTLVGFALGPLLGGSMAFLGSISFIRKYTWRATVGLAVILAGLLGIGLAVY